VVLKETFIRSQELYCKITRIADEKLKATHKYLTEDQFLTCEDSFHEALDYISELLNCYEPNPIAPDTDGFDPSFRIIVASAEDQLADLRR